MSVSSFEQRLQQLTALMGSAPPAATITGLKSLQQDISHYLSTNRVEQDDAVSQLQIAVFNNLACLYERRGKYRSSLYHLQLSEELENKYFTHKYQGTSIPLKALEKLATTYSNLSAVQSKLGNYQQALLNAEFAIQVLSKDAEKDHKALVPFYYNYSFLLDTLSKHSQATKFSLEGLRLSKLHKDKIMIGKFQTLIEGLKEKLARKEGRKIKELKRHLKGQLGLAKNHKQIQEKFLKMAEAIELQGVQLSDGRETSNQNFTTLKQYLEAERKHLKPNSSQAQRRHRSTYSTLRTQKNNSLQRQPTFPHHSNAELVRIQFESDKSHKPVHIPKTFSEYSQQPGQIRHNRMNSTISGGRDYRIKARKIRLAQQIEDLTRKNDALTHIIEKMHSAKDHS